MTNINIINVSNSNLMDLVFKNLTAREADIFLAVCYKCQRRGNKLVKIDLSELEQIGGFYAYDKQRLCACVESIFKKLLKFYFVYKDDKHYDCFTLFTRFRIDYEDNFVEISVNEPFMNRLCSC